MQPPWQVRSRRSRQSCSNNIQNGTIVNGRYIAIEPLWDVVDRGPKGGGEIGMTLLVIVALAIAAFIAFQFLGNEKAETGAVTEAVQKVGDAAQNAGDAA